MNGLIATNIVVENTTNPGQLQTITDTVAYHRTGSTYFDKASGKGYVYGYAVSTLTANSICYLRPFYNATDGTDTDWEFTAVGSAAAVACYVVAPCAAIPATYYGWAQFKGDNTAVAGLTNETRQTAGAHMIIHNEAAAVAAATAWGVPATCFAVVRVVNTTSTTVANLHFIGREITSTT
jgi:hypothetical protein